MMHTAEERNLQFGCTCNPRQEHTALGQVKKIKENKKKI